MQFFGATGMVYFPSDLLDYARGVVGHLMMTYPDDYAEPDRDSILMHSQMGPMQ